VPRRTALLCLVTAVLAATVAAGAGGTLPRPTVPGLEVAAGAPRIVDRTFACAPIAFLRTGGLNPESHLVLVRPRSAGSLASWRAGPAGVYASARRCTPARASLPLSSRDIGGAPTQWEKELDCPVRGRVLVRVRSVLQAPADGRRVDRLFAGARQPVLETKLAVRLRRTGKPIAYMEHDAKGKTKLWYSGACS
jgi:hypothetical protein